jgi:hypothetical protein
VVVFGGGRGIQVKGAAKYRVSAIVPKSPHKDVKTMVERLFIVFEV